MSRYTGPRRKVIRALGVELPGLTRHVLEGRNYPPGQHGERSNARRKSNFGEQLIEKQKLRFNYGLGESQLRRLMLEARRATSPTGDKLVELLERRLDNVVFRAGFAPTTAAARQLVSHGHIQVNGKRVTIPSYRVRVGEVIEAVQKSKNHTVIKMTLVDLPLSRPEWLKWDEAAERVTVTHLPAADATPFPIELQKVVEYYSTRL
jgi:small subunit ribosomal protein S4